MESESVESDLTESWLSDKLKGAADSYKRHATIAEPRTAHDNLSDTIATLINVH